MGCCATILPLPYRLLQLKQVRVFRTMLKTETEAAPEWPEGAVVKEEPWANEEEEPPAWPEGAIVKVEEEPPVWPDGAIVKQQEQELHAQHGLHALQAESPSEDSDGVEIESEEDEEAKGPEEGQNGATPAGQRGRGHGCELAISTAAIGDSLVAPVANTITATEIPTRLRGDEWERELSAPLPQSKHPGVSWNRATGKWRGAAYDASERYESGRAKNRFTKCFADEDECNEARKELKRTIDERNAAKDIQVTRSLPPSGTSGDAETLGDGRRQKEQEWQRQVRQVREQQVREQP